MGLTKENTLRKGQGGITKNDGGNAGSYASRNFGESTDVLLLPEQGDTILAVWATDQVEPQFQKARQQLTAQVRNERSGEESFWETANRVGAEHSVTPAQWQSYSGRHLLPAARAAAELQMMAQARIHADGGEIPDREPRVDWVTTFLPDGPDVFSQKLAEAFPIGAERFKDDMHKMAGEQPPSWMHRQVFAVSCTDFAEDLRLSLNAPEPQHDFIRHLDEYLDDGYADLDQDDLKLLHAAHKAPMGTVFIRKAFLARRELRETIGSVDASKLNHRHQGYPKWLKMRKQAKQDYAALMAEADELERLLPREDGTRVEWSRQAERRWVGMDDAAISARRDAVLQRAGSELKGLDRTSTRFPQHVDFDKVKPGETAQIGLFKNAKIRKVNDKSIVDEDGKRHPKESVWSVA